MMSNVNVGTEGLILRLPFAGSVLGTVVEKHAGVPRACVVAVRSLESGEMRECEAGENGRFDCLGVQIGENSLVAWTPDGWFGIEPRALIRAAATPTAVTIVLDRGGYLAVHVRQPARPCEISVEWQATVVRRERLEPGGLARLVVPGGWLRVIIRAGEKLRTQWVVVAPGRTVEIVVP